jgi:hypothetical protein
LSNKTINFRVADPSAIVCFHPDSEAWSPMRQLGAIVFRAQAPS